MEKDISPHFCNNVWFGGLLEFLQQFIRFSFENGFFPNHRVLVLP